MTIEQLIEFCKINFHYDTKTGQLWRRFNNCYKLCDSKYKNGYGRVSVNQKEYLIHRIIWLMEYKLFPIEIDHKDRNKLNNKLSNLREVTRTENNHNKIIQINNTSGAVGVDYRKERNRWRARIDNKLIGYFITKEEAIAAYNNKNKTYYF